MALAVEGSLDSYNETGLSGNIWWNDGRSTDEISRERRIQLAAEMETEFRTRCSAFLLATVEMIRQQCENCLTEAVEDALNRYSSMIQESFQLSCGSNGDQSETSSDDVNNMKVEDSISSIGMPENDDEKVNMGDSLMNPQWATNEVELEQYKLDREYESMQQSVMEMENARKDATEPKQEAIDFDKEVKKMSEVASSNINLLSSAITTPSMPDSDLEMKYNPSCPPDSVTAPHLVSPSAGNTCEVCGRSFSRRSHLIRHRMVHTGERPFHCHLCHRRFSQKVHLTVHTCTHNAHHSTATNNISESQSIITSTAATEPPVWPSTIMPSLPGVTPPSHCPVHAQPQVQMMPPPLPQSKLVPLHLRKHRCSECGKSFTRSSHLSRHRLIHTGERPHVCTFCRKAFSQKVHLQAHLRRQHPSALSIDNQNPSNNINSTVSQVGSIYNAGGGGVSMISNMAQNVSQTGQYGIDQGDVKGTI